MTMMSSAKLCCVLLVVLLAANTCSGLSVTSQLHAVSSLYEWRALGERVPPSATSADRFTMRLLTVSEWGAVLCPACEHLLNATRGFHQALAAAAADRGARVDTTIVDCSAYPLGEPPCAGTTRFPALTLRVDASSDREDGGGGPVELLLPSDGAVFADVLGLFNWASGVLPAGLLRRDFKHELAAMFGEMPEGSERSLFRAASSPLPRVTEKDLGATATAGLQMILFSSGEGSRSAARLRVLENAVAEGRLGDVRRGGEGEGGKQDVLVQQMAVTQESAAKWVPAEAELPQLLLWRRGAVLRAVPGMMYHGAWSAADFGAMVNFFSLSAERNDALPQSRDDELPLTTVQLKGLADSEHSQFVNVVSRGIAPRSLSRAISRAATVQQTEGLPSASHHIFFAFCVAEWVTSRSDLQREINAFVSVATSFDYLENADYLNASFSIVDLSRPLPEAASQIFFGGDPKRRAALCPHPPCLLYCEKTSVRDKTCQEDGAFRPFPHAVDELNLEQFLSSRSTEVLSFDGSGALVFTPAVSPVDSFRPWYNGESDVEKEEASNSETFREKKLLGFQNVFVLVHNFNASDALSLDASRRALGGFEVTCRAINGTTAASKASHRAFCASLDATRSPALSRRFDKKRGSSAVPFLVHMYLVPGLYDSKQAQEDAVMSDDIDPSDRITTPLPLDNPLDIVTNTRKISEQLFAAIGETLPQQPHLRTLTESTFERVVHDAEFGVLVLFSGGRSCPHSASVADTMESVAKAFARDRGVVVIAQIDASGAGMSGAMRQYYGVNTVPQIRWFGKGFANTANNRGELFEDAPYRDALLEFVHEEMGYKYIDLLAQKDVVPTITSLNFEATLLRKKNESHTVLLLYSSRAKDKTKLDVLEKVQSAFLGHSHFSNQEYNDADTGVVEKGALVRFYKMNVLRFKKLLSKYGLPLPTAHRQQPDVLFLPKGEYKLVKYKAMLASNVNKKQNDGTAASSIFSVESVAQFVLSSLQSANDGRTLESSDVRSVFSLSDDELAFGAPPQGLLLPNVVPVDETTFRDFVDSTQDVVVLYYASWCDHSKRYMPVFSDAASAFAGDTSVKFGMLDVPKNPDVGHGQGIQSFPTVLVYFAGSDGKAELIGAPFDNYEDSQALVDFVGNTRRTSKVAALDRERKRRAASVVDLNETSFRALVEEGDAQVLLQFHAPWCGHCRHMINVMLDVAEHYARAHSGKERAPRIIVAKMDGIEFSNISARFNATEAFPVVRFFTVGAAEEGGPLRRASYEFKGHRFPQEVIDFMNKHMPRFPVVVGTRAAAATTKTVRRRKAPPIATSDGSKKEQAPNVDKKRKQRPRRSKGPSSPPPPPADETFSHDVQITTETALQDAVITNKIALVFYHTLPRDQHLVPIVNELARVLTQGNANSRFGFEVLAVEAQDSVSARKLLGAAPSLTLLRGHGTPSAVTFEKFGEDDDVDDEEFARAVQDERGGHLTSLQHVMGFVRAQAMPLFRESVEIPAAQFAAVTRNCSARVAVLVYAPWCTECRALSDDYDLQAQVLAHVPATFIGRLDIEKAPLIYRDQLGSRPLPALVVYDGQCGADGKKAPRYLKVRQPTLEVMTRFILNELIDDDDQELLRSAASHSNGKGSVKGDGEPTPAHKRKGPLNPLQFATFDEVLSAVSRYRSRLLLLLTTSWCTRCVKHVESLSATAPRLVDKVAIGHFLSAAKDDDRKVKDLFGVASFPAYVIFGGDDGETPQIFDGPKLDGGEALVSFVSDHVDTAGAAEDVTLPTADDYAVYHQRDGAEGRKTHQAVGSHPAKGDAEAAIKAADIISSPSVLRSAVEKARAQQRPVIALTTAVWCSHSRCHDAAEVAGQLISFAASSDVVLVVDISDAGAKREAVALFGTASAPAVLAACGHLDGDNGDNGGFHALVVPARSEKTMAAFARALLDARDDMCGSGAAAALSEKMDTLGVVEGPVRGMSAVSVLETSQRTSNVFALLVTPECEECDAARQVWRVASGKLQDNPSLTFATVDVSEEENMQFAVDFLKENAAAPLAVLFTSTSRPEVFRGRLATVSEVIKFLEEQERRVHWT